MTKSMRFLVFSVAAIVLLLFSGCQNQFQSDKETTQFSSLAALSAGGATTLPIPTRPSVAELVELRNALPAGRIVSWGRDDFGQVSNAPEGFDYVAVAAGGSTSLALRADGTLEAWGRDLHGEVSDMPDGNDFVAIAAGEHHCLALRENGTIIAWGDDRGHYKIVSATPDSADFVAISTQGHFSLALRADGTIVAWGLDYIGAVSDTPADDGFVAISAGSHQSLALRADGSLIAWGDDGEGQVSGTPEHDGFVAIAASAWHNLALRADGSIIGWGWDSHGQVSKIPGGSGFVAIEAAGRYGYALRADRTIAAWGDWDNLAAKTPEDEGFVAIAGGGYHSVAIQVIPEPMTPADRMAALQNAVNALDGVNRGQQQALLATLNAAERSLENGRDHVAVNQLGAFVNQVQAFQRSRRLSDNDADTLIQGAETLIGDLTA